MQINFKSKTNAQYETSSNKTKYKAKPQTKPHAQQKAPASLIMLPVNILLDGAALQSVIPEKTSEKPPSSLLTDALQ